MTRAASVAALGLLASAATAQVPPAAGPAARTLDPAASYQVSNGFFYLDGRGGRFTTLRVDPQGHGQYARSLALDFGLGEPGPSPELAVRKNGDGEIVLDNLTMRLPGAAVGQPLAEEAVPVPAGGAVGQTFVVASGGLARVEARLATYRTAGVQVTLRLRRDGPKGEVLKEARLRDVADNAWATLETPDLPPGTYCLEAADPAGRAAWWAAKTDRYAGGVAWINGAAAAGFDLSFRAQCVDRLPVRWTLAAARNQLLASAELLPTPVNVRPVVRLTTPWHGDGQALDHPDILFNRFVTANGTFVPASQLKRRPLWAPTEPCAFLHFAGRGGYDLRLHFTQRPGTVRWTMTPETMTFHPSEPAFALEVLPRADWMPDFVPRFDAPDPAFAKSLNNFLVDFNFNFPSGANPDWFEWLNLALDWTDHPFRARQRAILLGTKLTPEGYVHSWGDLAGWPFPDPATHDTRHFVTNAQLVIGTYLYYCWTRDAEFLAAMKPNVRRAMDYQLGALEGAKGLIVSNGRDHTGRNGALGSNYWDILPFGHLSAYENIYFYESLRCLAELERRWGRPERAAELEALRAKCRDRYNATFWRADRGRYVGCIDADGREHDFGFVFLNLEAAYHGLPDGEMIRRMYKWLETEPTSSGQADVFTKWVFAPRATTIHNPGRAEDPDGTKGWWYSGWEGTPFGEQCQDGGAILYTSYYDLMVRARAFGADNAHERFRAILARYNEADRLGGGSPRSRGETAQGPAAGAVGTDEEFPESGLVPAGFLYCFIGAMPDLEGLRIRPNLPKGMAYAVADPVAYAGRRFALKVTPSQVELAWTDRGRVQRQTVDLPPGGCALLTPDFKLQAAKPAEARHE